ncbi:MAG: hypothetical protein R2710_27625 [Acidimicrobiales bacterium]
MRKISRRARWGRGALTGPHEQHQLAVGDGAHQPLDEGGAEEAGRSGDGDAFACQLFCDHSLVHREVVDC